jgi:hypothetical protein
LSAGACTWPRSHDRDRHPSLMQVWRRAESQAPAKPLRRSASPTTSTAPSVPGCSSTDFSTGISTGRVERGRKGSTRYITVVCITPARSNTVQLGVRMVVMGGPVGCGQSACRARLTCQRGILRLISRGFDRRRRIGLRRRQSRMRACAQPWSSVPGGGKTARL